MKTCPKCQEAKPVSEFGRHVRKPDGLRAWCKKCSQKPARICTCMRCGATFGFQARGLAPNLCVACEATHWRCFECKAILPAEAFGADAASRTGRSYKCRSCWSEYSRGAGKRAKKAVFVQFRYGIPLEEYEAHMLAPAGVCPCCGKSGRKKMCLDHDHVTGAIRGAICSACNSGIGLLGDDIDGVRKALAYLERFATV